MDQIKTAHKTAIILTRVSASQRLPFNACYTTKYGGRRTKDSLDLTDHDHESQVLWPYGAEIARSDVEEA
ncbi:hypothetical protein V6Z11_A08G200700 [Gossypium hirsutum]